jgi:hypothetical protein
MRDLRKQVYTLPQDLRDAITAIFEAQKELREAYVEVRTSFDLVLHAEPSKQVEGMIRQADGTNWDPGSGAGLYQFRGGSWRFLG